MVKNKKGFTLTEILAVVVILSILILGIIGAVSTYIQHGKNEYNNSLKAELLAAGKTYFSEHKNLLPTASYITVNSKTYNYVTAATLASNGLLSKDLVDSEKRECNSQSFVYAGEANEAGQYDWHSCLICTKNGEVVNYSKDEPICEGQNWKEKIIPRCSIKEDKIVASGNSLIDHSIKWIIFTPINEGEANPSPVTAAVTDFDDANSSIRKNTLIKTLETAINNMDDDTKKPPKYGTWKVELCNGKTLEDCNSSKEENKEKVSECGGIEITPKYSCKIDWNADGTAKTVTVTDPDNIVDSFYYEALEESEDDTNEEDTANDVDSADKTDNVDAEEDAGVNNDSTGTVYNTDTAGDSSTLSEKGFASLTGSTPTEKLNGLITTLTQSLSAGEEKEYQFYIGASSLNGKYVERCDSASLAGEPIETGDECTGEDCVIECDDDENKCAVIDKEPPTCSLQIKYTNSVDNNGRYKFKTVIETSDNVTPANLIKKYSIYSTKTYADFKTEYQTKNPTGTGFDKNGYFIGSELTYNSDKVYKVVLMDEAGNKKFCYHKLVPPLKEKPRCYFDPDDPNKDKWLRGGQSRKLTAYCLQPKDYSKNKAVDYIKGTYADHNYKHLYKSVSKKGNWRKGQTSGNWRKITINYVAKKYGEKPGEKHISKGLERVKIDYGYIYLLNSNKKKINYSPTAYSPRIKVDNAPPTLKSTVHSKKHGGAYHASSKSPFKVTFKCKDRGAGLKSITVNGKKYTTKKERALILKHTLKRTSSSSSASYKVVCEDNVGNKKTKTYTYKVKNYSCSTSACGSHCSSYYSYYTYYWEYIGFVDYGHGAMPVCPGACTESVHNNKFHGYCTRVGETINGNTGTHQYHCASSLNSGCNGHSCNYCWHY